MSSELIVRLSAYPKMKAALDKLPPKMLALNRGMPESPISLSAETLEGRVDRVAALIHESAFTGSADKATVPDLYREYVTRIAVALQKTLAFAFAANPSKSALPLPEVPAPPVPPVRFAPGQLLLIVQASNAARAAGDVGATRFGVGGEDGRVSLTLACGDAELAYDACVQAVLPWQPGKEDGKALLHSVEELPALAEAARELHADVQTLESQTLREEDLARVREAAKAMGEAMAAHRAMQAVRTSVNAAIDRLKVAASSLQDIQAAVAQLLFDPEAVAGAALRGSGMVGKRRYASGQWLTVMHGGVWQDSEVVSAGSKHKLRVDDGDELSLQLHPWNHAPRELALDAFKAMREWWAESLRSQHASISDALTGTPLDALKQCVAIEFTGNSQLTGISDVRSMTEWLHWLYSARLDGNDVSEVAAALLTGPPAAGKTTLISQAVVLALDRAEMVPIVIKVQQLQVRLGEAPDVFASSWNWVDAYLKLVHAELPSMYRTLRQAMMARRALLLIDGLDEGGTSRRKIERHVVNVLAPQGHVVLCTSRPAGVDEEHFKGFHRLKLAPLTDAQQHEALTQRLGAAGVAKLMPFVERMPLDTETGRRVTANPLMLSMVASVFEIRKGVDMPNTIAALYESASEAMLARGGIVSAEMRTMLEAVLFEAHAAQKRVITEMELNRAALAVFAPSKLDAEGLSDIQRALDSLPSEAREAASAVRERVAQDNLPLLSLLQVTPVQMQSSHLSFQEYYCARAICSGKYRLPKASPPPWQWPPFWANAVKLGGEMGDAFGKGLLKAAGVEGRELDLAKKLGGDQRTSLAAVVQLACGLTSLNLAGNTLVNSDGIETLASALKTNTALQTLKCAANRPSCPHGTDTKVSAPLTLGVVACLQP